MNKTFIEGVYFLFNKFKSLVHISFKPSYIREVRIIELVMSYCHSVQVEDIKKLLLVLSVIDATIPNSLVVVVLMYHLPVLDVLSNFIVILREV